MPRFPNSVLLKLNLIIGICALAFACDIHAQHTKFFFMTDNESIVTPCEKTPHNDPSEVLAELEESGLNCTEGSECPTCGCFVFFAGRICSCKNSVEWTISFFDDKGHCERTQHGPHLEGIHKVEEKELSTSGSASAEGRLNFEHFSFDTPENEAWTILALQPLKVTYVASMNKVNYRITLFENHIEGWSSMNRTAQSIADDFRAHEKQGMVEMGVKQGLYELHDLVMGEMMVGDNLFYTMAYTTKARSGFKSVFESAKLYLYFPNENYVEEFFVVHYSESASKRKRLGFTMEPDLLKLLGSLSVTDSK